MTRDELNLLTEEIDFWPEPYKHTGKKLVVALDRRIAMTERFTIKGEQYETD